MYKILKISVSISPNRLSSVNAVFSFKASQIDSAPSGPILLPFHFIFYCHLFSSQEIEFLSHLKLSEVNESFFFMALLIVSVSLILLPIHFYRFYFTLSVKHELMLRPRSS